jgi:hypothetical protein
MSTAKIVAGTPNGKKEIIAATPPIRVHNRLERRIAWIPPTTETIPTATSSTARLRKCPEAKAKGNAGTSDESTRIGTLPTPIPRKNSATLPMRPDPPAQI